MNENEYIEAVEAWCADEGAMMIEEAYCENPRGDRVQWIENNWDTICEWYDDWIERV